MDLFTVSGSWKKGLVLDKHIISSECIGHDAQGKPKFNTIRTELGDIVYEIKYHRSYGSTYLKVYNEFFPKFNALTSNHVKQFIIENNINLILGAPFSSKRTIQPVDLFCDFISNMTGIPYIKNAISKKTTKPSKDMDLFEKKNLYNQIEIDKSILKKLDGLNILIIDDLYQTGTTLEACTKYLQQNLNYANVYVLGMTKTRG